VLHQTWHSHRCTATVSSRVSRHLPCRDLGKRFDLTTYPKEKALEKGFDKREYEKWGAAVDQPLPLAISTRNGSLDHPTFSYFHVLFLVMFTLGGCPYVSRGHMSFTPSLFLHSFFLTSFGLNATGSHHEASVRIPAADQHPLFPDSFRLSRCAAKESQGDAMTDGN
jgi:hypothetical protein